MPVCHILLIGSKTDANSISRKRERTNAVFRLFLRYGRNGREANISGVQKRSGIFVVYEP